MSSDPAANMGPERLCPEHGWIAHAAVREAARAIAAVDLGVAFERVEVVLPKPIGRKPDRRRLGGMLLKKPFTRLTQSSPLLAFQMACAGTLGEQAVLSHYVDKYWVNDLRVFRAAVGLTDAVARDDLDEILREDARSVTADIVAWAMDNSQPINALASALRGSTPEHGPRFEARDNWTLTEDEVLRLLGWQRS